MQEQKKDCFFAKFKGWPVICGKIHFSYCLPLNSKSIARAFVSLGTTSARGGHWAVGAAAEARGKGPRALAVRPRTIAPLGLARILLWVEHGLVGAHSLSGHQKCFFAAIVGVARAVAAGLSPDGSKSTADEEKNKKGEHAVLHTMQLCTRDKTTTELNVLIHSLISVSLTLFVSHTSNSISQLPF